MAELVLEGVTKLYDDGPAALSGVDLRIADGELLTLLGPSGSGKSTLLNVVAGLVKPTSGNVYIGGRLATRLPPHERDVAAVFQKTSLYPHLSVKQNLRFALDLRHVEETEANDRTAVEARVLRLRRLLHRMPKTLSSGESQRVAMGRATVRVPNAFLLDEPLSHLDAGERRRLRRELCTLQRGLGVTTLYITHDQADAMSIGDRVAVLRTGVLQQVAPPRVLYDRPANAFVAEFVGEPAMNLVPGRLERDQHGAELVLAGQRLAFPGQPSGLLRSFVGRRVLAGIRPEHLHPADGAARPGRVLAVVVESVERLGDEVVLHTRLDGAGQAPAQLATKIRRDAQAGVRHGDHMELAVDTGELHVFDPDSGEALWHCGGRDA